MRCVGVEHKVEKTAIFAKNWLYLFMAENNGCEEKKDLAHHFYVAVMVSAACIIILLCFTSRRKRYCKNILWGIPSVIVPVNLLGGKGNGYRLVYCVVLSCWGGDLLNNILDRSLYYSSQYSLLDAVYFFMFSPSVIILGQALAYFPVFACVDTTIPLLGHSIGLLYTSLLITHNVHADYVTVQGCSYRGTLSHREIGITLGSRAWTYFFYLILFILYFMYTIFDIAHVLFLGHGLTQKCKEDHEVSEQYVKNLLKKQVKAGSRSHHLLRNSLWNYLIRGLDFVLPNAYTFYLRYPLPLLGGYFMGFAIIIHLVIFWSAQEYILAEHLLHWLQEFNITVTTIEKIFPSTKPRLDRFYAQVLSFAKAYEIILPLGSVTAFGLCVLFTLYMIQNTHKHFMEAAKGDTNFFVRSQLVPSLTYRLAATMRITAFQVAYLVTSWMIYSLIMWILMSIGLFFYYAFNDFRHFGVHFWSWFMVPMMWGAAVYNVQLYLCKFVFLERHQGTMPLIRLRWLCQILAYFLFFFNVIFGLVMCILRVFGMVVFTVVMLFRLDWDVYMRGLEGWDTGHRTYIAYIYMEYSCNNMILRQFAHLLLEAINKKNSQPRPHSELPSPPGVIQQREGEREREERRRGLGSSEKVDEMCSQRARLRWYLAYTLLRNPTLCQDRVNYTQNHNHTGYGSVYSIN